MQDLKNETGEIKDEFSFDIFFGFTDLNELPKSFLNLLPGYCDRILQNLDRVEELLKDEDGGFPLDKEAEIASLRMTNQVYLSTPALYRSVIDPLAVMPNFERYDNVITDDFFFI